jgi:hypothetical protein
MEIQSVLMPPGAKVDIEISANAVKTCKPLLLFALQVPQKITDVLQIEVNTVFGQSRPLSTPVSEQVPVGPLSDLTAVGAAQRFVRGL